MREHRHLGVYAIITKGDFILLIKKSRGAYMGKFDLPGGGIEHGETIMQCLKREINEETGLCLKCAKIHDAYTYNTQWDDDGEIENLHHIGIIYDVEAEGFEELKISGDGQDSLGACWKKIYNIENDKLSPFAYDVVTELLCAKRL